MAEHLHPELREGGGQRAPMAKGTASGRSGACQSSPCRPAPSGAVRLKSTSIPATAQGQAHAQVLAWLQAWGEPSALLLGMEATGSLWEPLYDALTQAGYPVLLLNPHQTASWATSLGLRAKTAGSDAHTLARGLLAGGARASSVPDETVQALRARTRARRDLVENQRAARQRRHEELVTVFPAVVTHLPARADLGAPAGLRLLAVYRPAQAMAQRPPADPRRWTLRRPAASVQARARGPAPCALHGARGGGPRSARVAPALPAPAGSWARQERGADDPRAYAAQSHLPSAAYWRLLRSRRHQPCPAGGTGVTFR